MKTADQLLSNLQELGLFSEDAIGETKRRWQQSGIRPDAVAAAKELVKSGRLTRYQAEEILNGRGARLSFGAYVILDKLGQGGMGMVLRGQHREMKRPVAIKMLPKEMLKNQEASQRFKREAEAAGRLLHPNIVTAYDSGTLDGTPYLVMELVAGSDLHSFVSDHGPMRVLDAIHCITEVARGLEYAHDQGIVHRDIKPANLLLATGSASGTTKAGAAAVAALAETAKAPDVLKCRVKVLDMGLARIDEGLERHSSHFQNLANHDADSELPTPCDDGCDSTSSYGYRIAQESKEIPIPFRVCYPAKDHRCFTQSWYVSAFHSSR